MTSFEDFFRTATRTAVDPHGWSPHGYQSRIARDELPAVVEAPTGTGKTGIVLAWLWRRLHGPDPDGTPRRLIYALPQRSLVEQVAGQVGDWLVRLGLEDQVALHVVMGGHGATHWSWRMEMHKPAIVVGTVDSLVSKALNRGYGIGRSTYPVDFALVTNGAHWIIDEIQLCPESTTTLRQIAAFARGFGTAEPFGLTCMSATVSEALLGTVDNPPPSPDQVVRIEAEDRIGELKTRLDAKRAVRRLVAEPGDYAAVAREAASLHRPGSLTLVVLNTVSAARDVYKALRGGPVPCTLLHSRFRAWERSELARRVSESPGTAGHMVVATQVVEAGVDLNASVLVTEAAPWPCVVQRAGRCNRTGRVYDAELRWLPPAEAPPYLEADVKAAIAELEALEAKEVTGEDLLAREVAVADQPVAVLRRPDLLGLFDTTPDLSGSDLDVAPYVRDTDDLDVQLAWAAWTPDADARDGCPPAVAKAPGTEWRCRVPLHDLSKLAERAAVWRLDQVSGRWTQVAPKGAGRARPGEVLVMSAADGGYDPETGFDPASKKPVADHPVLNTQRMATQAAPPDNVTGIAGGLEDAFGADSASVAQREWVQLHRHSEDARQQAAGLISVLRPQVPDGFADAVVKAAYLHDAGKAHPVWQDALCQLATPDQRGTIEADRPWAKSDSDKPLRFKDDRTFRHELASLLLLNSPLAGLLAETAEPGLIRYLVLAHHGRLRIQVRDPDEAAPGTLLGLIDGEKTPIPGIFGLAEMELVVDLDQFNLGGDRSWTREALALRDRCGPFMLAYLETLVRVADWRASAGEEVPR